MNSILSPNTQAILLLTAPLIAGSAPSVDILSPGEYKRLARLLWEMQRQPADLLSSDAVELIHACQSVVEEGRLLRLLGRGFLLGQVIERWQARAMWVVSRADANYPRRIKQRLREDAPAVLYGCGDINLLDTGGFAVVGSRHVNDALIDYTIDIGRLAARAGKTLISGGAKGIDQAAMRSALEAGGTVIGVLANNLEKTIMNREHRNHLIDGQLLLISPYDPSAGFNVGNAMQRNKLIYALADAALVVSSDFNKGGTWAGATEQLDKFHFVPVYVRSTDEASKGLDALRKKGAIDWPNPQDADAFNLIFDEVKPAKSGVLQQGLPLFSNEPASSTTPSTSAPVIVDKQPALMPAKSPLLSKSTIPEEQHVIQAMNEEENASQKQKPESVGDRPDKTLAQVKFSPADVLFATVQELIIQLLTVPMKEAEIAAALDVSSAQARIWLQHLIEKGVVEKHKKQATYVTRQSPL